MSTGSVFNVQSALTQFVSIYKKRVIIIGDSYGGRVNSENRTYSQIVKSKFGISDSDFASAYVPGAAFAHSVTSAKFRTILQGITISDHDTVTDIIVQCGANDANYSYASNELAIIEFIAYCATEYPNAKVTIFDCGMTFTQWGLLLKNINAHKAYVDSFQAITVANAQYLLYNTNLLESDRCHPNASGVDVIATGLMAALCGKECKAYYIIEPTESNVTVTATTGNLYDYIFAGRFIQNNGVMTISQKASYDYLMQFRMNVVGAVITNISLQLSSVVGLSEFVSGVTDDTLKFSGILVEEGREANNMPVIITISEDGNNNYVMNIKPIAPFTFTDASTSNGRIYTSASYRLT